MTILGLEHLVQWRSVEDWLHHHIASRLEGTTPPVEVVTRMRDGQPMPFVTVREVPLVGAPPADAKWVRYADVEIHCFADGIDAEQDAFNLASACETILRDLRGRVVGPAEKVASVRIREPAGRRSDWADAASTVQYQDLPVGVERFRVQARLVLTRRNK